MKAKPNAKEESVDKIDERHFVVAVKEPPRQGRANSAIVKVLADYFHVPQSNVRLVSGFSSKQKLFEIEA